MASLEVIALDPAIPQLRAPGPGDTYNMARRVLFAEGIQPRIVTIGSAILPLSWSSSQADIILITGQESALTIDADAGQPIDGQKIIFRIKDAGTAQPLSFAQNGPKSFRGVGFDLPVTTIAGKTTYINCVYNAQDDRWDVISTTDTQTLANKTLVGAMLNDGYTEEVFAVTGTAPLLSPTNGSIQTWTLSGNSTPTAGTWAEGQSITLMVDDGTAYTINWTSLAVVWKTDAGSAPTLNTTGYTAIALWKVGTTIYGARVGDA